MENTTIIINNVDIELLQEQKLELIDSIEYFENTLLNSKTKVNALHGILCLLDEITDKYLSE